MDTRKLMGHRFVVADALKAARLDAGFTQAQLANTLQVPQSWVSTVESAGRKVEVGEVIEIARALEVNPLSLMSAVLKDVSDES